MLYHTSMTHEKSSAFGMRLKELRAQANLSQAQLAERAGLHEMTISRIERGVLSPGWEVVVQLVRALHVTAAAFEAPR